MTLPVRPKILLVSRFCKMKKMAHTRNRSQPRRWNRFSPLAIFKHLQKGQVFDSRLIIDYTTYYWTSAGFVYSLR